MEQHGCNKYQSDDGDDKVLWYFKHLFYFALKFFYLF